MPLFAVPFSWLTKSTIALPMGPSSPVPLAAPSVDSARIVASGNARTGRGSQTMRCWPSAGNACPEEWCPTSSESVAHIVGICTRNTHHTGYGGGLQGFTGTHRPVKYYLATADNTSFSRSVSSNPIHTSCTFASLSRSIIVGTEAIPQSTVGIVINVSTSTPSLRSKRL